MKSKITSYSHSSLLKSFLLAFLVIGIVFVSLLAVMQAGNQDIRGRAASVEAPIACASATPPTCSSYTCNSMTGQYVCSNTPCPIDNNYTADARNCGGEMVCTTGGWVCVPSGTPPGSVGTWCDSNRCPYGCSSLDTLGGVCTPPPASCTTCTCAPANKPTCPTNYTPTCNGAMWYCGPVILSPTPPPIIPKLLLLGDSMIAATYVPVDLPPLLKSAGIPVIFIGDKIYPGNHIPTDGFSGFDTGTMLTQLTSGTVWKEANGTTYPNNFVNNIPDIVIIQLGTNDLIKPSAYQGDMQSIITFLHSKNQNVKIVVSKLIPSKNSASDNQIQLLNNAIPGFVQLMNSKYPPVVTTQDLRSIWKPEDFADDYHPSMTGSQKMAQSYYDALLANGFVSK